MRPLMPTPAFSTILALCATLMATGCSDGYPTDDLANVSPFEMTQGQRITALNEVGAQAQKKVQWRYALESACILKVKQRPNWRSWSTGRHRLDEASVETRFDRDADVHHVQLAPRGVADPVSVLRTDDRLIAQQASLLVKLLKRDCSGDAAV